MDDPAPQPVPRIYLNSYSAAAESLALRARAEGL
jgi:hypothetical protein